MNVSNTAVAAAPAVVSAFTPSSKFPLRFDRLHPGSLFQIVAEPSRGIRKSTDVRVYRKAQDHEGFYALNIANRDQAAVLMPFDLVQPVARKRV